MNEQIFSQWGGVIILIVLFSNLIIYGYLNWKSFKSELKPYTILDITALTLISGGFFFNLVTILCYKLDLFSNGIPSFSKLIFSENSKFAYTGLVLGMIISVNIIYRSSNRLKSVRLLLDKLAWSISILTFFDMSIFTILILNGYAFLDLTSVVAVLIMSVLTLLVAFSQSAKKNRGILSSAYIILSSLSVLVINLIHSTRSGVNEIELESVIAIVLLIYGVIEFASALPQKINEDKNAANNFDAQMRKSKYDSEKNAGSPLKYSQSYAKNDDAFADLSVKERVVSRINNLKRKSK